MLVTTTFGLLSVVAGVVVAGVSLAVGLVAAGGWLLVGVVHPVNIPSVSSDEPIQVKHSRFFEPRRQELIFTIVRLNW